MRVWGAGVKNAGVKNAGAEGAGASVWRVIFGALVLAMALTISGCIKQDAVDSKVAASKVAESKIDSSKDARAESSQKSAESNLDSSKESTQDTLTPQDLEVKDQQIYVAQTDADDTARACRAPIITRAKLSFVGDIVLGDYKGASGATFNAKFAEVKDYAYFSRGVREVLSGDDLTIGNMEGVLSDKNLKNAFEKPFSFKGQSGYTKILEIASIEALNVANNHSRDYGKQGFIDTVENLIAASRAVFGEGIVHIYEVNDVKFGLAGHRGWNPAIKSQVKKEIEQLKKDGADVVIFTFHWGEERQHYPNATQRDIAHFAIDSGADMVVGHHPHVLQGVEEYKGKKIVYSLGNFIYGGAKNPNDKDSMIYQSEFLQISSHAQAVELAKQIEGYLSANASVAGAGNAVGAGVDSSAVDSSNAGGLDSDAGFGAESSEAESSQNADKNSAKSSDNADKKNKKSK
ncbi:CapA family protein, partial [Helicobacter sp. CLO-3]|uniref:CapA family protein n=3 Tax=Helicobacter TaxID=209 RepID=UPI001C12B7ED